MGASIAVGDCANMDSKPNFFKSPYRVCNGTYGWQHVLRRFQHYSGTLFINPFCFPHLQPLCLPWRYN
jgi:hypothetical protein